MACIQKKPVNANNFLRWHTATDLYLPVGVTPGFCGLGPGPCDVYADPAETENVYFLPLVNGDQIHFFINSLTGLNLGDFATLELGLLADGELKYPAIGGLSKLEGANGLYWLSGYFNVDCFKDGCYNPVIYRGNQVILISNPVRVCNREKWQKETVLVRYRNEADLFSYKYSALPVFYNQFRLDAWLYDMQLPENRETYTDLNYKTRTTSLQLSKTYSLQYFYCDDETHLASKAMLCSKTLQVNGVNFQAKDTLEITPAEDGFNLTTARVKLEDMDYAKNIRNCN